MNEELMQMLMAGGQPPVGGQELPPPNVAMPPQQPMPNGAMPPELMQLLAQMQQSEQQMPPDQGIAQQMVSPQDVMGEPTPSLSYDDYLNIAKGLGVDLSATGQTPSTVDGEYGYGVSLIDLLGGR